MNENNTELYPKIFTWLFIGLLISFASGYALSLNQMVMANILVIGALPILIIELVIAYQLSKHLATMKATTMKILYFVYCALTGITLSSIFVLYEMSSILSIFFVTAVIFGVLALYGYTTKQDLSKLGTILTVALLVSLIASIINVFFIHSTIFNTGLTILIALIFVGFVAYDMNKVKQLLLYAGEDNAAVYGAFTLYLDFINLFIRLLELFGKRND